MSEEKKVSFLKKGAGKLSSGTTSRAKNVPRQSVRGIHNEGRPHIHKMENGALQGERSLTDLINELGLIDHEKENLFDPLFFDDIRRKPDLWMAAFDNPVEFIQYCRKKVDHERELLENSRQVEDEIRQFVEEWSKNTDKHARVLEDLFKVQDINDKLQEAIMEERTHCQHLVGINDQLETQKQILERKYQASLLLGKVDDRAVNHLLERNPKAVPLADKLSRLKKEIKTCDGKNNLEVADPTVLAARVQTLEKYAENLKRQHREEVAVLKETISQSDLKCESIKAQYKDLVQRNAKSLEELKEVLGVTIRENLDLRAELVHKDTEFLETHLQEVKHNLRKPSSSRIMESNIQVHKSKSVAVAAEQYAAIDRENQLRLSRTQVDLAAMSNCVRESTQKILILERKCARLEEENRLLKSAHEHAAKALKARNETLLKRCEKTENRLKMERAGNGSDLRECKTLLKTLITGVKAFGREHTELKRKLSEYTKKSKTTTVAQPEPDSQEVVKTVATQSSGSDLKILAMNLWLDYMQSKVNQLENQATTDRAYERQNFPEEDDGGLSVLYVNPTITEESLEHMRSLANSSDKYFSSSRTGARRKHSIEDVTGQSSGQSRLP